MKHNEEKQRLSVMKKIFDNSHNKQWECIETGCSEPAINSHLLQRHGLLSNIIEDGHLIEVRGADMMRWNEDNAQVFQFKKVGLQQAISLKIFCNTHDTSLFYDIEHGDVDYDDYRTQLLLSYRAQCAEKRKKQIDKEMNARWRKSSILYNPNFEKYLQLTDHGYDLSLRDIEVYLDEIKGELQNPTGLYTFYHYTYPKLGVYASSAFSYDEDGSKLTGIMKSENGEIWDSCFIHILPLQNSTEIIIGYSNNHTNDSLRDYAASWGNLNNEELGIKLTNLFAGHIDGWGMAPSLLDYIDIKTRKKYTEYVKANAQNYSIMQEVGFNLFKDCFTD